MNLLDNLNNLRDESNRIAIEHGFTEASVPEDLLLMTSEITEALEDHRANHAPDHVWYEEKPYGKKPCGIPSEMADLVIRILHFSGKHSIDIEGAIMDLHTWRNATSYTYKGDTLTEELMYMVADLTKALADYELYAHVYAKKADGSDSNEPLGVPMRLASVILRAIRFSERHGIDIAKAIEEKQAFNRSRPFKHGNKKL